MKRAIAATIFILIIGGCSSVDHSGRQRERTMQLTPEEYRIFKEKALFAEPYKYIWDKEIVQTVVVPAAIRGGVFYPAHKETVVIRPAEPVLIREVE